MPTKGTGDDEHQELICEVGDFEDPGNSGGYLVKWNVWNEDIHATTSDRRPVEGSLQS